MSYIVCWLLLHKSSYSWLIHKLQALPLRLAHPRQPSTSGNAAWTTLHFTRTGNITLIGFMTFYFPLIPYSSDEKVDHSVPKSRSARFVRYNVCYHSQSASTSLCWALSIPRTSSGRYIRKSSKVDVSAMASGRGGVEKSNVNSGAHM